jgi:hypothetical protein
MHCTHPPLEPTCSLIRFISDSASVAQSIIIFPDETPARVPVSPSNTARLASGVESILKTILSSVEYYVSNYICVGRFVRQQTTISHSPTTLHNLLRGAFYLNMFARETRCQFVTLGRRPIPYYQWHILRTRHTLGEKPSGHSFSHDPKTDESDWRHDYCVER